MTITHDQFNIQIQRLAGCFGEQAKRDFNNPMRLSMIWGYMKDLTAEQGSAVVDHFIQTARKAPLPTDFKDAASAQRKTAPVQQVVSDCGKCMGVGTISAWRRGAKYISASTYSFRCPNNCTAAWKISRIVPEWSRETESDFLPVFGPSKTPDQVRKTNYKELYGISEPTPTPAHTPRTNVAQIATQAVKTIEHGLVNLPPTEDDDFEIR